MFPVSLPQGNPVISHLTSTTNATLYGRESLLGHSLGFFTGNDIGGCGRIMYTSPTLVTASAVFGSNNSFVGVVFFEQDSDVLQTTITVVLAANSMAVTNESIRLLVLDHKPNNNSFVMTSCPTVNDIFNPTSTPMTSSEYVSACRRDSAACAIGAYQLAHVLYSQTAFNFSLTFSNTVVYF